MPTLDEKISAAKKKLDQANRELQALRREKQEVCNHTWKVDVRTPAEYVAESYKVCQECELEVFIGFN